MVNAPLTEQDFKKPEYIPPYKEVCEKEKVQSAKRLILQMLESEIEESRVYLSNRRNIDLGTAIYIINHCLDISDKTREVQRKQTENMVIKEAIRLKNLPDGDSQHGDKE